MGRSGAETCVASFYRGLPLKDGELFTQEVTREGLAPFFFHQVKSSASNPFSSAILDELRHSFVANVALHLNRENTLLQILNHFERQRISCLVLKGMALAYLVYPDPATRTMGDIDLLIQPNQIRQASETLVSLGYRPISHYAEYEEELLHFGGELAFYKERESLVELHWMLEQYERLKGIIRIDEGALWQRTITYSVNGVTVRTLCLEDQLLTLSIHLGLVHRMQGLKWLLDIDRVIRTFDKSIDWTILLERARQWGISRLLSHVLWLSRERFATPIPPRLCLRPVVGSTTPFGSFLFLDRWPDRFIMLKRILFPSGDWLRFRYHLKKGQRLFPYRVLHPFRLLCGKFS